MESKKIVRVTAPLSQENVRLFFTDKTVEFEIDYVNSKIKQMPLLTYVSNLNLPFSFYFGDDDIAKEERFALMKAYMVSKTIVTDLTLAITMANVLLVANGYPEELLMEPGLIRRGEYQEFIQENLDDLFKWKVFFDSLIPYALNMFEVARSAVDVKEGLTVIDDPDYVGRNVVNLINLPDFLMFHISTSSSYHPHWLKWQFESPVFNGNTLYHYFSGTGVKKNDLANLMAAMVSGQLPPIDEEILNSLIPTEVDGDTSI